MATSSKPQQSPLVESVKKQIVATGGNSLSRIVKRFGGYDTNNDNMIDFDEFFMELTRSGITLTREQATEVFKSFDRDGNGVLSTNEFILALRPPMSPNRQKIVMEAFKKCDVNNDGNITVEDLVNTYDVSKHPKFLSGEWTKNRVLKEFLDKFQPGCVKDDKVTQDEFMDYYALLSAHIDRDVYFDYMVRQAWKI